jgi:hypothetical protein
MAIPSFTDEDILNDYDTQYFADYTWGLWQLRALMGYEGSNPEGTKIALRTLEELRDYMIEEGKTTNLVNTDGTIDLSKARTPGLRYLDEYDKAGRLKVYGAPDTTEPPYLGYIDGVFCIVIGSASRPYKAMAEMPGPRQLIAPNLILVNFGPHRLSTPTGVGGTLQVVDFTASFMTIYGETQLSNPIQIGPLLDWTSITLAVVEEDIPVYATAVKYYRLFGEGSAAVYRLVGQVKVNGS